MKQVLFYAFALMVLYSCNQRTGSGNIVTEKRQTGDFTGISVGSGFELELKTGPTTEVVVEADDNLMKYIETHVSGNVLDINTKDISGFNNSHVKVYVTAPEINSINSSGAAKVKVIGQLKNDHKISLEATGAAEIKASVDAPEVSVEISGAGNMDLDGRTKNYAVEVSGGGHLASHDLKSENATVEVSGAGSANVHASVSLKADASGAGNISYTGGANVQSSTSGAGSVKKED